MSTAEWRPAGELDLPSAGPGPGRRWWRPARRGRWRPAPAPRPTAPARPSCQAAGRGMICRRRRRRAGSRSLAHACGDGHADELAQQVGQPSRSSGWPSRGPAWCRPAPTRPSRRAAWRGRGRAVPCPQGTAQLRRRAPAISTVGRATASAVRDAFGPARRLRYSCTPRAASRPAPRPMASARSEPDSARRRPRLGPAGRLRAVVGPQGEHAEGQRPEPPAGSGRRRPSRRRTRTAPTMKPMATTRSSTRWTGRGTRWKQRGRAVGGGRQQDHQRGRRAAGTPGRGDCTAWNTSRPPMPYSTIWWIQNGSLGAGWSGTRPVWQADPRHAPRAGDPERRHRAASEAGGVPTSSPCHPCHPSRPCRRTGHRPAWPTSSRACRRRGPRW